jgi:Fe-S-cluster-containing dehydrogenase component
MEDKIHLPSRRDFLTVVTAGTASGLLASCGASSEQYGMLIDITECKYCKECIRACEAIHANGFPGTNYTDVKLTYPRGEDDKAVAFPLHCVHCTDPPCVPVCQSGALEKTPIGPVTLDDNKCIGCLSCVSVCPFENCLTYQALPARMFKCDMCYDLIVQGEQPACVDACQNVYYDALVFGTFGDILEEGRKRAAEKGALLLYPEKTANLVLFREEDLPVMADLYGYGSSYSIQADAKATITELTHYGWLPIIGGLAFYIDRWRKNRIDQKGETEK